MKRAFYLMVLLPILIALTASCTKDFEEINTSPNNATVASTPYILTYVEANLGSYFFDEWRAGRQAWLFSQHMSQTNYTTEDRYTLRVNVTSTYFKNMYVAIQALQDIIRLNEDAKTAKTVADDGGENAMQVATARILKAYAIEHLAESFGLSPTVRPASWRSSNSQNTILRRRFLRSSGLNSPRASTPSNRARRVGRRAISSSRVISRSGFVSAILSGCGWLYGKVM